MFTFYLTLGAQAMTLQHQIEQTTPVLSRPRHFNVSRDLHAMRLPTSKDS